MSKRKYPMSEQDAQKIFDQMKELKGGTNMENVTNAILEEEFEIDFDFDDLVEETTVPTPVATPVTDGANALAVEVTEAEVINLNKTKTSKATRKKTATKKSKLEVLKETGAPVATEAISEVAETASNEPQAPQAVQTTATILTTAQKAKNGLKKLSQIETFLNQKFLEREEVIANVLRSLAIGTNMLLLGEPGTGKSDLIQSATSMIEGANHFQWLVNRTSDPAELVGPYSIKAMEQDKFVRKTAGKLPEAHVAFIDEIKLGLLA